MFDANGKDANGWTREDYSGLIRESVAGLFQPEDWLAFATNESGLAVRRPEPLYNRRGTGPFAEHPMGAKGLWQAMPFVLKNLGWLPGNSDHESVSGDFREAPIPVQVKWSRVYLDSWRKHFKLGTWRNAGDLYLCNFAPARLPLRGDPDGVVFSESQGKVYSANAGLDRLQEGRPKKLIGGVYRKGYINVRDMWIATEAMKATKVYKTAVRSLNVLAQEGLNRAGASLAVDGIVGPKTLGALTSFRSARKLPLSGLTGAARADLLQS